MWWQLNNVGFPSGTPQPEWDKGTKKIFVVFVCVAIVSLVIFVGWGTYTSAHKEEERQVKEQWMRTLEARAKEDSLRIVSLERALREQEAEVDSSIARVKAFEERLKKGGKRW
jgi:Tfp pilus assembly protein PilO